jgi:hypothetical protein
VEFEIDTNTPKIPAIKSPLNVELLGTNPADGIPIEVLLFHSVGMLTLLEFVVYGEPLLHIPSHRDIRESPEGTAVTIS